MLWFITPAGTLQSVFIHPMSMCGISALENTEDGKFEGFTSFKFIRYRKISSDRLAKTEISRCCVSLAVGFPFRLKVNLQTFVLSGAEISSILFSSISI